MLYTTDGECGVQHNVNFIISTGDNIYEKGLTCPDDEQFSTSFSKYLHTEKFAGHLVLR